MLYLFIFSKNHEFWLKQLYIVLTTIFLHMYISTSLVFMTLFKSLFRKEKGKSLKLIMCLPMCEEIWWSEQCRAVLTKIHGL